MNHELLGIIICCIFSDSHSLYSIQYVFDKMKGISLNENY